MKLAIDLGGTNIRVARVAGGQIVDRKAAACPAQASEKEVLDALEALVGSLMTDEVEGIGVGVPSVVDAERGIVYNVANIPSWKEVHLKDLWQSRFGVPVAVNNDANCFALGEYSFGKGRGYRNMLGITLGTGVGAGVIIDGKLYNGMDTGAGEIGSIPYLDLDYEQYCSSSFFVRCYGTTGKEAALKAAHGSEEALQIWRQFGVHVGKFIEMVLFAYAPDAVVLGGSIANAWPYFEESVRKELEGFPYPQMVEKLFIGASDTPDVGMLGASMLI